MLAENLELLRSAYLEYTGGSPVWIVYALSLIYLAFFAGKEARRLIVWPTLLAGVTLFNPFLIRIIGEKFGVINRVPRIFWFLIYFIVVGYALVHLIGRFKKRWVQAAIFAAACAAIILLGNPVFSEKSGFRWRAPENSAFVSTNVLQLVEIWHSEGIEEPKILYDSTLMQSVRTFDPSIKSEASRQLTFALESYGYVRDYIYDHEDMLTLTEVFFLEKYETPPAEFIQALKWRFVDYVTTRKGSGQDGYMRMCGMELVGETPVYNVWKIREEE